MDTVQGPEYSGCCYQGNLSTVSILRAGEVLEPAISAVCKDIRMGKILIQTNEHSGEPEVRYSRNFICTKYICGSLCLFCACPCATLVRPAANCQVPHPSPASPFFQLHYLRLPTDVASCHVLLLDATVATGAAALMAIRVLLVGVLPV